MSIDVKVSGFEFEMLRTVGKANVVGSNSNRIRVQSPLHRQKDETGDLRSLHLTPKLHPLSLE